MEKIIKLKMNKDKALIIFLNDEEKYTIESNKRSLNAEKIYEILDYSKGDHYLVESENEYAIDPQVLEFFEGLLKEIVGKVNEIGYT